MTQERMIRRIRLFEKEKVVSRSAHIEVYRQTSQDTRTGRPQHNRSFGGGASSLWQVRTPDDVFASGAASSAEGLTEWQKLTRTQ